MLSVAQLAGALQTLFTTTAEEQARACALIRRQRAVAPPALAQGLVFAWLQDPEATLPQLASSVTLAGSPLSPPALCQRFNPACADFFLGLLRRACQLALAARAPAALPLLGRFEGVYLLDGTPVTLPPALAEAWPGVGGKASPAGLKGVVRWEITRGELRLDLLGGRQHETDSAWHEAPLPKGALRLADLGFFDLGLLARYDREGVYWVSRVHATDTVRDAAGWEGPLWQYLQRQPGGRVEGWVEVGKGRLRCRLLALRCPARVALKRRQRALRAAAKQGRQPDPQRLVFCDWTVFLSNIPEDKASWQELWVLYRVRWQVELLFKRWKSLGLLEHSRGSQPYRVLVEVYGKLLGALVEHWLVLTAGGWWLGRSLWRASREVRGWAKAVLLALGDFSGLLRLLAALRAVLLRLAGVDRRRQRPATFQTLSQPEQHGLT
jgi:Transposase DDE domain